MMEAGGSESETGRCYSVDLEDGRRGLETRNADGFQKLKKAKEKVLP